jgi:hypothetical protein
MRQNTIAIIFNSDGSLKMTTDNLDALDVMIENENLTVKEVALKDFIPDKYIYSLTEAGEISSEEYTLEPPPNFEQ